MIIWRVYPFPIYHVFSPPHLWLLHMLLSLLNAWDHRCFCFSLLLQPKWELCAHFVSLYGLWAPEQTQELEGARAGGAWVPVLSEERQANKTKNYFLTQHAVKLEINVTKELEISHIFHEGERDQTNTWRKYPFPRFLNSKVTSLLYEISQVNTARNW